MAMTLKKTVGGGGDFPPAPQGFWRAVCVDVIDRGEIPGYQGKMTHKVDLIWQLEVLEDDGKTEIREADGSRFQILGRYTYSLHESSNLCQALEAWRGKPFEEDEAFDLESVIGANCQIQVAHAVKEGKKTKAVVQAIVVPPKNVEPLKPENYIRWKDRKKNNGEAPEESADGLPF